MSREQIEAWRRELYTLRFGWEYAFVHGAVDSPEVRAIVEREGDLIALIAEHTP